MVQPPYSNVQQIDTDFKGACEDNTCVVVTVAVTTGDQVINITGDVVNLQLGKNNKMVID